MNHHLCNVSRDYDNESNFKPRLHMPCWMLHRAHLLSFEGMLDSTRKPVHDALWGALANSIPRSPDEGYWDVAMKLDFPLLSTHCTRRVQTGQETAESHFVNVICHVRWGRLPVWNAFAKRFRYQCCHPKVFDIRETVPIKQSRSAFRVKHRQHRDLLLRMAERSSSLKEYRKRTRHPSLARYILSAGSLHE